MQQHHKQQTTGNNSEQAVNCDKEDKEIEVLNTHKIMKEGGTNTAETNNGGWERRSITKNKTQVSKTTPKNMGSNINMKISDPEMGT